jgi:autotransporter adhesin
VTSLSTSTSTSIGSLSTSLSSITTNTTNLGTSTAEALGGGATYDPATGKISSPSYVTYNNDGTTTTNQNVGAAVDNINAKGIKYFHANSTEADSEATGENSVAIGPNAKANLANSVAIGNGATTSAAVGVSSSSVGGVTFGGYAGANPIGTFSVGAPGQERQVTNVAAGRVSADSTDAVNGSQLFATNSHVASLSTSLNTTNSNVASLSTGLSTTNSNVASLSTSTSTSISSLSTGLSTTNSNVTSLSTSTSTGISSLSTSLSTTNNTVNSLSTSVTNINNQISNLSTSVTSNSGIAADSKGDGTDRPTVTAGSNSVAIGSNSNDGGRNNVVSVGSAEQQRQITNVAPGTQGTDAVNLNQLNGSVASGVSQANNYTDQRFNDTNRAINDVAKNAYSGIAAALAMPNLTPSAPGRTVAGVGVGSYKSGKAVAVSVTHRSENGRWLVNGGVAATSSGDTGVRAQVGYEW